MKRVAVIVIGVSVLFAGANSLKKYDIKSGKIEYKISGSGNIMGMGKMKVIGKSRLIFDNFGAIELDEESKVEQTSVMGNVQNQKSHTLTLQKDGTLYNVDFARKRVVKSALPASGMVKASGKSAKELGLDMLKQMGGKKTGTSKVLGYPCDIWELMGTKQCIYKGITLSSTTNMMGIKLKKIATKAQFNIDIDKSSFKLPNYKVTDMYGNSVAKNQANKGAPNGMPDGADMAQAMQGMAKMAEAMQKSGANKDQEEMMQNAVINAMGGEQAVLKRIKSKMMRQVNSGGLEFAKKCFSNANTLKEANICIDKGNKRFSGDEPHLRSWSKSDKAKMLNDIKQFEKSIPCINASTTMQALEKCIKQ